MKRDQGPPKSMSRRAWRASILTLFLAPFALVLMATGVLFLWENPWMLKWAWWPIPLCWIIGFCLFRWGRRKFGPIWRLEPAVLDRWTPQDKEAWQKVMTHSDELGHLSMDDLLTFETYSDSTRKLAETLATHYHPGTRNAIDALTVPEILTAAELAIADLGDFVERYIPGSHLVTIRNLRRVPKVSEGWSHLKPLYNVVSILWSPWTALTRVAADGTVMTPVVEEFKKEGMASIYRAFILQAGKYLIELYSHRLKVGPDRWRELTDSSLVHPLTDDSPVPEPADGADEPGTIQIVVVGQVKAGKSSLINAMIGTQQAAVDLLPLTDSIKQYTLRPASTSSSIVLLDTVGFAHQGPKADQWEVTMRAVCESAMMILVVNACEPAREPESLFVRELDAWFGTRPHLRRPPILVVLTHIDGLPPRLEWDPPYDTWVHPKPKRNKEQNIHNVVQDVRELFGRRVDGVVPACTDMDNGRVYGIDQWVVPALLNLLPQAQAKQLVDVLFAERDQNRLTRLMTQFWNASSLLAKYHFCGPESVLPDEPDDREGEPDA